MSNHNTATLRKLGESAKDVSGKVGNAILDFDWSPLGTFLGYAMVICGFFCALFYLL
jgi:hypothetical protein